MDEGGQVETSVVSSIEELIYELRTRKLELVIGRTLVKNKKARNHCLACFNFTTHVFGAHSLQLFKGARGSVSGFLSSFPRTTMTCDLCSADTASTRVLLSRFELAFYCIHILKECPTKFWGNRGLVRAFIVAHSNPTRTSQSQCASSGRVGNRRQASGSWVYVARAWAAPGPGSLCEV